jgi:outer membrane murein-binding lipoprotein Lpp
MAINDSSSNIVQSMTLRPGDWCLVSGVWWLCAAVAAISLMAGCASPSSAPVAAPRAEVNPAEVDKLEREAAEIESATPAAEKEIAALQERRARLALRQQARANGEIHLLYDDATGKLALFHGSRQLLLVKVEIKPAVPVKKAASTPATPPSQEPPPAPGRYLIRSIERLFPATPLPKIKGRKPTAGGNARILFGDALHDLGFITTPSSPNKPPAPKLPRWNVTVSSLDSLVAAVKPETALFVEE